MKMKKKLAMFNIDPYVICYFCILFSKDVCSHIHAHELKFICIQIHNPTRNAVLFPSLVSPMGR